VEKKTKICYNKYMKRFTKGLVKAIGDTDGLLTGVVGSTADVDRYQEIINQETWQLDNYKSNPVILWAHNLTFGEDRPPIGKAVRVGVEDGKLVFDIQFDMADSFAADIFRKYKEKFLNAFSVGFIAHQEAVDDSGHTILLNNELLELSAVPVPANPMALQSLKARSFSVRSWESLIKEVEDKQKADTDAAATPTEPAAPAGDAPVPPVTPPTPPAGDTTQPGISTDDTPPVKPEGEIEGGDKARKQSPTNPEREAKAHLLKVVREATRQLQTALALANSAEKIAKTTSEKGITHKK